VILRVRSTFREHPTVSGRWVSGGFVVQWQVAEVRKHGQPLTVQDHKFCDEPLRYVAVETSYATIYCSPTEYVRSSEDRCRLPIGLLEAGLRIAKRDVLELAAGTNF
jgi:hypothetical protein